MTANKYLLTAMVAVYPHAATLAGSVVDSSFRKDSRVVETPLIVTQMGGALLFKLLFFGRTTGGVGMQTYLHHPRRAVHSRFLWTLSR